MTRSLHTAFEMIIDSMLVDSVWAWIHVMPLLFRQVTWKIQRRHCWWYFCTIWDVVCSQASTPYSKVGRIMARILSTWWHGVSLLYQRPKAEVCQRLLRQRTGGFRYLCQEQPSGTSSCQDRWSGSLLQILAVYRYLTTRFNITRGGLKKDLALLNAGLESKSGVSCGKCA